MEFHEIPGRPSRCRRQPVFARDAPAKARGRHRARARQIGMLGTRMEDFAGNAPAPGGLDTHNLRVDARRRPARRSAWYCSRSARRGWQQATRQTRWPSAVSFPDSVIKIRSVVLPLPGRPSRSACAAWASTEGSPTGAVLSGWLRSQSGVALSCFLAGLLLNGADVAAEALHLHGNLPLERFFLGALLGIATGVLLTMPFAPNPPGSKRFQRSSRRRDDSAVFHPRTS